MNREGIIIIICIGIVVLFYLSQENTAPVEQVGLVKEPIVQNSDVITKDAIQQIPREVQSATSDTLSTR